MSDRRITISEPLARYLDELVAEGRFATQSEGVEELIEADRLRHLKKELETKLLIALDAPGEEADDAYWERLEQESERLLADRRRP